MTSHPRTPRAFSLVEMLVVIGIISLVAGIARISWKSATAQSVRSLAVNTLSGYLGVARSYAVANKIETMLVVNPWDGRLELWRANPPTGQQRNPPWDESRVLSGQHPDDLAPVNHTIGGNPPPQFPNGGTWDVRSNGFGTGTPAERANANGYAFVPVLDNSARLPVDSSGMPKVLVFPLEFGIRAIDTDGNGPGGSYPYLPYEPIANNRPSATGRLLIDNLTWACVCFGPDGRLITRARRIDMNNRGSVDRPDFPPRTALDDGADKYSVDMTQMAETGNVHAYDSLLLSSAGLIVCERAAFEAGTSIVLGSSTPNPRPGQPFRSLLTSNNLAGSCDYITAWLGETRTGGPVAQFATYLLLDQWTGRPVQVTD